MITLRKSEWILHTSLLTSVILTKCSRYFICLESITKMSILAWYLVLFSFFQKINADSHKNSHRLHSQALVARTTPLFSNFLFTNLFSIKYCQNFSIRTHGWRKWRTTALTSTIGSEKFHIQIFGTFLTLSLKLMRLLGMDTCPSLNDIMEIRCNKCTRSELHALWIISIYKILV
jgi:hypothetical protein